MYYRWKNLPSSRTPANPYQDRWRPLFVEEMTKAILESGHLKAVNDHYELTGSLSTFAIPATFQDSLMARLDRLVTAKAIAQYAAVIGRQFAYDLLQRCHNWTTATLQRELGQARRGRDCLPKRGSTTGNLYL